MRREVEWWEQVAILQTCPRQARPELPLLRARCARLPPHPPRSRSSSDVNRALIARGATHGSSTCSPRARRTSASRSWLTTGGEVLGRNEFGEVATWARPARARRRVRGRVSRRAGSRRLRRGGDGQSGRIPRCWERLRELTTRSARSRLFSYARTFLEACLEDHKGVVLFHAEEPRSSTEDEEIVARPQPHDSGARHDRSRLGPDGRPGAPLHARERGVGGPGTLLRQVDAGLNEPGYGHVGDFAMSPISPGRRAVVPLVGPDLRRPSSSSAERGVASTHFLAPPGDASFKSRMRSCSRSRRQSSSARPSREAHRRSPRGVPRTSPRVRRQVRPRRALAGTVEAAAELLNSGGQRSRRGGMTRARADALDTLCRFAANASAETKLPSWNAISQIDRDQLFGPPRVMAVLRSRR